MAEPKAAFLRVARSLGTSAGTSGKPENQEHGSGDLPSPSRASIVCLSASCGNQHTPHRAGNGWSEPETQGHERGNSPDGSGSQICSALT